MNLPAIQHFAFDNFCYQLTDDDLEISINTGKDVDKVFIVAGDPFAAGILGGDWQWNGKETEITEKKELQNHYRWTTVLSPEFKRVSYYFRIVSLADGKTEEVYYTYNGLFTKEEFEKNGKKHGRFTYPWMNPIDTCRTPSWVENTVWYQIFPARFCRGKTDFIPENLLPWAKFGEAVPSGRGKPEPVYGGNIQGMIDKLDYLQELGITGIYTTPLNKSSSQHKYNTDDYEQIAPDFGDAETMKEFVRKAHEHGIRIMLDGVFNHSGWFFDKWQDVWKNREKSEYKDWFMINDFNFVEPSFGYGKGNSGTGKFFSFAFVDFMPKLNTNNPEVRKYIIDVCKMWVREYDIDGLRLDVANEISHVFCQELNVAMKSMKPDFYIVGEIWHNSQPWLRGQEYDSVMNYPLQNAIADFCCTDDMTAKEFEYAINRCYSMYYRQVNRVLFNQMDSHDTIRILNRCDGNKVRARQALALMFAMTGSVCIYYGTEIMLEGSFDPDNRRCMPWKEIEEGRFNDDMEFMKSLISLRRNHPAMTSSRYDFVYDESNPDGKERTVKILKTAEDKSEKICVEINSKMTETSCHKENILFKEEGILIYRVE